MPERYYPWPANRLGRHEIHLLWCARQGAPTRTTICALLAQAVRQTYGHLGREAVTEERRAA